MATWETVEPVIRYYAARTFRGDADLVGDTITLAWFRWSRTPNRDEIQAASFAWFAIKQIRAGRNLPGIAPRKNDAMYHAWQCGLMGDVRDRKPGPEQTVMMREELDRLRRVANRQERELMDLAQEGLGTKQIAQEMNVSEPRVSQLRRQVLGKAKE